ncbi:LysR family transcriptional regulator [Ferrimonas pelagia]
MITLDQITCFQAVYQCGSYSSAGRQLNKDRTTVREHILALEDLLNAPVFVVEGKKAVATELAHYLYPRANLMYKQAHEFMRAAISAQQHQLTELTLCYDTQAPQALLLAFDQAIAHEAPYLNVHYLHRNRDESTAALEQHQAQMALVITKGGSYTSEHVGMLNLGGVDFRAYAHPNSALCQQEFLSLNTLSSELQWVVENSMQTALQLLNISSKQQVISNIDLLVGMLAHRGWALLNSQDAAVYVEQGRLQELQLEQMARSYHANVALFYDLSLSDNPQIQQLLKIAAQLGRRLLK